MVKRCIVCTVVFISFITGINTNSTTDNSSTVPSGIADLFGHLSLQPSVPPFQPVVSDHTTYPSADTPGNVTQPTQTYPSAHTPGNVTEPTQTYPSADTPGNVTEPTETYPSADTSGNVTEPTETYPSADTPGNVTKPTQTYPSADTSGNVTEPTQTYPSADTPGNVTEPTETYPSAHTSGNVTEPTQAYPSADTSGNVTEPTKTYPSAYTSSNVTEPTQTYPSADTPGNVTEPTETYPSADTSGNVTEPTETYPSADTPGNVTKPPQTYLSAHTPGNVTEPTQAYPSAHTPSNVTEPTQTYPSVDTSGNVTEPAETYPSALSPGNVTEPTQTYPSAHTSGNVTEPTQTYPSADTPGNVTEPTQTYPSADTSGNVTEPTENYPSADTPGNVTEPTQTYPLADTSGNVTEPTENYPSAHTPGNVTEPTQTFSSANTPGNVTEPTQTFPSAHTLGNVTEPTQTYPSAHTPGNVTEPTQTFLSAHTLGNVTEPTQTYPSAHTLGNRTEATRTQPSSGPKYNPRKAATSISDIKTTTETAGSQHGFAWNLFNMLHITKTSELDSSKPSSEIHVSLSPSITQTQTGTIVTPSPTLYPSSDTSISSTSKNVHSFYTNNYIFSLFQNILLRTTSEASTSSSPTLHVPTSNVEMSPVRTEVTTVPFDASTITESVHIDIRSTVVLSDFIPEIRTVPVFPSSSTFHFILTTPIAEFMVSTPTSIMPTSSSVVARIQTESVGNLNNDTSLHTESFDNVNNDTSMNLINVTSMSAESVAGLNSGTSMNVNNVTTMSTESISSLNSVTTMSTESVSSLNNESSTTLNNESVSHSNTEHVISRTTQSVKSTNTQHIRNFNTDPVESLTTEATGSMSIEFIGSTEPVINSTSIRSVYTELTRTTNIASDTNTELTDSVDSERIESMKTESEPVTSLNIESVGSVSTEPLSSMNIDTTRSMGIEQVSGTKYKSNTESVKVSNTETELSTPVMTESISHRSVSSQTSNTESVKVSNTETELSTPVMTESISHRSVNSQTSITESAKVSNTETELSTPVMTESISHRSVNSQTSNTESAKVSNTETELSTPVMTESISHRSVNSQTSNTESAKVSNTETELSTPVMTESISHRSVNSQTSNTEPIRGVNSESVSSVYTDPSRSFNTELTMESDMPFPLMSSKLQPVDTEDSLIKESRFGSWLTPIVSDFSPSSASIKTSFVVHPSLAGDANVQMSSPDVQGSSHLYSLLPTQQTGEVIEVTSPGIRTSPDWTGGHLTTPTYRSASDDIPIRRSSMEERETTWSPVELGSPESGWQTFPSSQVFITESSASPDLQPSPSTIAGVVTTDAFVQYSSGLLYLTSSTPTAPLSGLPQSRDTEFLTNSSTPLWSTGLNAHSMAERSKVMHSVNDTIVSAEPSATRVSNSTISESDAKPSPSPNPTSHLYLPIDSAVPGNGSVKSASNEPPLTSMKPTLGPPSDGVLSTSEVFLQSDYTDFHSIYPSIDYSLTNTIVEQGSAVSSTNPFTWIESGPTTYRPAPSSSALTNTQEIQLVPAQTQSLNISFGFPDTSTSLVQSELFPDPSPSVPLSVGSVITADSSNGSPILEMSTRVIVPGSLAVSDTNTSVDYNTPKWSTDTIQLSTMTQGQPSRSESTSAFYPSSVFETGIISASMTSTQDIVSTSAFNTTTMPVFLDYSTIMPTPVTDSSVFNTSVVSETVLVSQSESWGNYSDDVSPVLPSHLASIFPEEHYSTQRILDQTNLGNKSTPAVQPLDDTLGISTTEVSLGYVPIETSQLYSPDLDYSSNGKDSILESVTSAQDEAVASILAPTSSLNVSVDLETSLIPDTSSEITKTWLLSSWVVSSVPADQKSSPIISSITHTETVTVVETQKVIVTVYPSPSLSTEVHSPTPVVSNEPADSGSLTVLSSDNMDSLSVYPEIPTDVTMSTAVYEPSRSVQEVSATFIVSSYLDSALRSTELFPSTSFADSSTEYESAVLLSSTPVISSPEVSPVSSANVSSSLTPDTSFTMNTSALFPSVPLSSANPTPQVSSSLTQPDTVTWIVSSFKISSPSTQMLTMSESQLLSTVTEHSSAMETLSLETGTIGQSISLTLDTTSADLTDSIVPTSVVVEHTVQLTTMADSVLPSSSTEFSTVSSILPTEGVTTSSHNTTEGTISSVIVESSHFLVPSINETVLLPSEKMISTELAETTETLRPVPSSATETTLPVDPPSLIFSETTLHVEPTSLILSETTLHVEPTSPMFSETTLHVEPTSPMFSETTLHVEPTSPMFSETTLHVEPTSPMFSETTVVMVSSSSVFETLVTIPTCTCSVVTEIVATSTVTAQSSLVTDSSSTTSPDPPMVTSGQISTVISEMPVETTHMFTSLSQTGIDTIPESVITATTELPSDVLSPMISESPLETGLSSVTSETVDLSATKVSSVVSVTVPQTSSPDITTSTVVTAPVTPPPNVTSPTVTPTLSMNDTLKHVWVVTVIKVLRTEDVTTKQFEDNIEGKLATSYNLAFIRAEQIQNGTYVPLRRRRRKRYAEAGDIQLEVMNVDRAETTNNVDVVYYMEKSGEIVPAQTAISTLSLLSDQELALQLGYVVETQAKAFVPVTVEIPEPPQYWIIGAVLGSIAGAVLIVWCTLCIYFRCCRAPPAKDVEDEGEPHLVGLKDKQDFEASHPEANYVHEMIEKARSNGMARQAARQNQSENEDPVYAQVRKPKKRHQPSKHIHQERYSKEEEDGSVVGDTTQYVTDGDEDSSKTQVHRLKRKPKPRKRSPGEKKRATTEEGDEVPSEESTRTSIHYLRMAPGENTARPLQNGRLPNVNEPENDLQQKVDLDRWKNKQRQREKRRHSSRDKDHKRRTRSGQGERTGAEVVGSSSSRVPQTQVQGFVNGAYSESEPEADRHPQETLNQARQRMHQLLDDAFSLVTPVVQANQQNKISPRLEPLENGVNGPDSQMRPKPVGRPKPQPARRRPSADDELQELKKHFSENQSSVPPKPTPRKSTEKKHTPLIIDPGKRLKEANRLSWNPYRAGDKAADLALPQEEEIKPTTASSSPFLGRFQTTTFKDNTPVSYSGNLETTETHYPQAIMTTDEPQPIIITTRRDAWSDAHYADSPISETYEFLPKDTSTLAGASRSSAPKITSKYAALIHDLESDSAERKKSQRSRLGDNGHSIEMEPLRSGGQKSRGRLGDGRDELDVVKDSVGMGVSPEPLIRSIREELMRLSSGSPSKDVSLC